MVLKTVTAGEAGRTEALTLARQAILDLSMPFLLSDIPVQIDASAGILVGAGTASASSTAQILERVDRALYAAKRAGGGRWTWSDEGVAPERAAG